MHRSVTDIQGEDVLETFSLHKCLMKFMEKETLDDYVCPKCKGQPVTSSHDVARDADSWEQKVSNHVDSGESGTEKGTEDDAERRIDVELEPETAGEEEEDNPARFGLVKSMSLWRLPMFLIIQMKRFKFDRFSHRKLNQKINFPLTGLDMAPYITKSRLMEFTKV